MKNKIIPEYGKYYWAHCGNDRTHYIIQFDTISGKQFPIQCIKYVYPPMGIINFKGGFLKIVKEATPEEVKKYFNEDVIPKEAYSIF